MKTTADWLDELKRKNNLPSDYSLAKLLGVPPQNISKYMSGQRALDPYMAVRVANMLEVDAIKVIASVESERTRDVNKKDFWRQIAICIFAVAGAATGAIAPPPAQAAGTLHKRISHAQGEPVIHIVRKRRRRKSSLQDAASAAIEIAAATLGIKPHRCL